MEICNRYPNVNIWLTRKHKYKQEGRYQSEKEAIETDDLISKVLHSVSSCTHNQTSSQGSITSIMQKHIYEDDFRDDWDKAAIMGGVYDDDEIRSAGLEEWVKDNDLMNEE